MSDQPVVLAVAGYRSKADAERDFVAVWGAKHRGEPDHIAVAVLEKGADGRLVIDRHDNTAKDLAWGSALLGGALTVIAAPLGILFLATVGATSTALAGVSAIADHFWQNIPQEALRRMSDLVEAGQAALVVVAVDHSRKDIEARLANATTMIVTDGTPADFASEYRNAIDEANALS